MEATSSGSERNVFFQRLKPCCVKISQLAIRESSHGTSTAHELGELINQLTVILVDQIQRNPLVMDEKLAEYVFFPLYHIFRQMDQYPMPLVENSIKCLTALITHGWKSKISPKLVQQILTLLTFVIDGSPTSNEKRDIPEETVFVACQGLKALFDTAGSSVTAASGLSETAIIPALGHSITVILDTAVTGATPQIQQEALGAIQALYMAIRDHEALASFLPGVTSSFARLLSTPARYKKSVLSQCLDTVTVVLTHVLADMKTRPILAIAECQEVHIENKESLLTPAWLKATVTQVKRALSTMMKLRNHDSPEVRNALKKLCVKLLDECHSTLSDCTPILIETAMVLDDGTSQGLLVETSLQDLVSIYPELAESVKTTVYNWMTSLPRVVQGSDEDAKRIALHNLLKGLRFTKDLHIESSTLEESTAMTLRDSIASLLLSPEAQRTSESTNLQLVEQGNACSQDLDYKSIVLGHESQKGMRNEMLGLISFLGSRPQQALLARRMLEYAQESNPTSQIAAFWLCFQVIKASDASSAEIDTFFDISSLVTPAEDVDSIRNELYLFSAQILNSHEDVEPLDWRLEAMALEVVAYTAHKSGASFRPELIDVLFPIATFLGSEIVDLQRHAVITMNSIAKSCEYENVSQLIIDNVDYMVNSVSLRLNTLDISPASLSVLKMMISLAGPQLVPYLDDVVESIFTSLDNYHGYPIFVEGLFSILKGIVEQGARSETLLLESQKATNADHRKRLSNEHRLDSLLDSLAKRKERLGRRDSDSSGTGHPKAPWKLEDKELDDTNTPSAEGEAEKPPNTPTYQLLLRVANLTQHYLTSPTPTLRRSLLELLTTAATALAADEDAFLPLVNAIWPVVVGRLRDPEAYITIEACHALSGLCGAAGDFLSSRFKTEWWDWLGDWCRKVKRQARATPGWSKPHGEQGHLAGPASGGSQLLIPIRTEDGLGGKAAPLTKPARTSGGGLGHFASPAKVWESTIKLLTALVSFVHVEDEMFDDILDILAETLDRDDKVREALETVNADAVWLVCLERGRVELMPTPHTDDSIFVEMERQVLVMAPKG